MPPFTPTSLITDWTARPLGLALVALAVLPYAGWLLRAHRLGVAWPWWRTALYLGAGVGTLAYAVCGPLAVHRTEIFWVAALQVGVLASLTPVGLALGDPVGLLRGLAERGRGPRRALRLLEGRLARALMFPAVSTLLAVMTVMVVFFTPWFEATTRSVASEALLYFVLIVTGLLFVLPLLTDELLPSWATPPVRTFLAFFDGLLDAVPGIVIMTASTLLTPGFPGYASGASGLTPAMDQKLGGGALLAVAEVVGLPVIAAVFLEWVRSDEREARAVDAELALAEEAATSSPEARTEHGTADGVAPAATSGLWWESDPRFAGRYGRRD
ncbi:cytochrome c oxidase assembly protein [Intrasporangium oryzae]|uniref:cytochrome c oxidase assembly protein n=1 Tax=Intrasporangium oryzae TaxID=412687 RepID=UPI00146F9968|nr:cytochrome c oxidase assembly protein [Intrasporangium oryzae]